MDAQKGKIVTLNEKGFGFLKIEGREKGMFFHASGLTGGVKFSELFIGDELSFESIENGERGECAKGLSLIGHIPE